MIDDSGEPVREWLARAERMGQSPFVVEFITRNPLCLQFGREQASPRQWENVSSAIDDLGDGNPASRNLDAYLPTVLGAEIAAQFGTFASDVIADNDADDPHAIAVLRGQRLGEEPAAQTRFAAMVLSMRLVRAFERWWVNSDQRAEAYNNALFYLLRHYPLAASLPGVEGMRKIAGAAGEFDDVPEYRRAMALIAVRQRMVPLTAQVVFGRRDEVEAVQVPGGAIGDEDDSFGEEGETVLRMVKSRLHELPSITGIVAGHYEHSQVLLPPQVASAVISDLAFTIDSVRETGMHLFRAVRTRPEEDFWGGPEGRFVADALDNALRFVTNCAPSMIETFGDRLGRLGLDHEYAECRRRVQR